MPQPIGPTNCNNSMANAQGSSLPGSLRSNVGADNGGQGPLQILKNWEDTLRDPSVEKMLIERGSPLDLLVCFPNLKEEWDSEVRQTQRHSGDQDAMVKLLNFIIKSCDETWPGNLQTGLKDCGQKLIVDLLIETHTELIRRPQPYVQQETQRSAEFLCSSTSINMQPSTSSSSIFEIQHRRLFTQAVRNCQRHLRQNLDPIPLLSNFHYLQKDRIIAANRTSGRGGAVDTFVKELMFPDRDHDWPGDLIQALRRNSQSILADLVLRAYSNLRDKAFADGTCDELKNHLSQQQPAALMNMQPSTSVSSIDGNPIMETDEPDSAYGSPNSTPGGSFMDG